MTKRYSWFNSASEAFMRNKESYLQVKHEHVAERVMEIGRHAEKILGQPGFADEFEEYMSRGYYSLSTPIWTNFGNNRGLGISCFNSYISDSMDSILFTAAEVGMMSKYGGGTSAYFGELRPRGSEIKDNGKSSGAVHFMQLFDTMTNIVSQGCYDEETEILTEKGWMSFSELSKCWKTTKVAQVNNHEQIEFVLPTEFFQYEVKEDLLHFKDSKNIDLLVTKNHNMVFKYEKKSIAKDENNVKRYLRSVSDKFKIATAEDCPLHRDVKFLHSGRLQESALSLSTLERLKIAYQADGYSTKDYPNYVKFRFAKKRKADRLEWLLKELGINYKYSFYEKDQSYNYFFSVDQPLSKTFDWVDLTNKSYQWASEFLLEVSEWDGSKTSDTGFIYSSVIKQNVDVVQAVAACAGYKSKVKLNLRETETNKQPIYNINLSRGIYFGVEKIKPEEVYYEGFVYCVEVPSHKLIVRRGGHTLVCGNSSRRGSFAAYLDIDHPDIEEFLKIRTEGFPIQDLSFGVCVPTWWLEEMRRGDQDKRRVWARVLQLRGEIGYPYIFFTDNVNNNTVDVYRDKKMKIYASNLCSEICLPTNENESFVCDLSSINLLHWDEIKEQPRVVHILVQLLDAVMTDFIERASKIKFMERAVEFAKNHRALGIGVLGLHSLYQSKSIPFESLKAKSLNTEIFKFLKEETYAESARLAERFGEPPVLKGYGRRNTTLLAVAPTTSSAFILGQVSQSIEPYNSNYFVKDVAKGKFTIKNPFLTQLLEEKGKNDYDTWDSILKAGGSVQHLDFLSQHEKDVFKTFEEISQKEIIIQASIRQKYIDQAQSLNLMIHPDTPTKDINELILFAHDQGIKTLYYQHSINSAKEFSRELLQCVNCE